MPGMVEKAEDTSGLDDVVEFLKAMGSRYRRVPALKRLGRLLWKWYLTGLVFVVLCIVGETATVGLRKAAAMYWQWWIVPPFLIAALPIAFTLILAIIELAFYVAMFPFALIGQLLGHSRAAFFKQASNWIIYLGFGLFVAWAAHDTARKDAAPKPAMKAATATPPPLHQPETAALPATSEHRFNWWTIGVALLSFGGGVAKTTFGSVTSTWAQRFVDKRRPVIIYGPNDKPR